MSGQQQRITGKRIFWVIGPGLIALITLSSLLTMPPESNTARTSAVSANPLPSRLINYPKQRVEMAALATRAEDFVRASLRAKTDSR